MGWALDGGEDIGDQLFDYHTWLELQAEISGIKDDSKRRVRELVGKYVVATKGRSSGRIVFYQDKNISSNGYWTQFLSNALGFVDINTAKLHANGFKYGNPRVAFVTSEGMYQWIK